MTGSRDRDGRARDLARRRSAAAQPAPMPPVTGVALLTCAAPGCGARHIDNAAGRDAHYAVFGHRPRREETRQP